MKVTATITIEIKGAKHELTSAEAQQLLSALQAALTPRVTSPLESVFWETPRARPQNHPYRLDAVPGHIG